ncbi:MAG: molybdopterin molybdotransferase MoeA, partial [Myxococcales bacterium]|nr:molybdopterin molybdotransferase MoeA [Myxococcales bacterium]
DQVEGLGSRSVLLSDARGLVLAAPVTAPSSSPPFSNSAMDGYAVRWADVQETSKSNPVHLPVAFVIAAGDGEKRSLKPGSAARIMTGAPMPEGADTVVMREDTQESDDEVTFLSVPEAKGANVRREGAYFTVGQPLFKAGHQITAGSIGVLASLNLCEVTTFRRPRVAIISTGDELVPLGRPAGAGQIVNSSSFMLRALVEDCGAEAVVMPIARDTVESCRSVFDEALATADAVVSLGGVSVGDFDVVKTVMAEVCAGLDFWQVKMKPGKPLAFGLANGKPLFGLPGNPVSSFVCFLQFVRPALRKMAGASAPYTLETVSARLSKDVRSPEWRADYQRGVLSGSDGEWSFEPFADQSSGNLVSLAVCNGLAVVPDGVGALRAGDPVAVERIPAGWRG